MTKKNRRRIPFPGIEGEILRNKQEAVEDPEAYQENGASLNAKKIKVIDEKIKVEFWVDKHYTIRDQHGDEFGKREGIGMDEIDALVTVSFKHLIYYSSKHVFPFINHPPKKQQRLRVVLMKAYPKKERLNVVAEYHFYKLNVYEVTVITAMCKDDYYFEDGQYAVEFHGDNNSILYYTRKKKDIPERIDDYAE